MRRTCPFDFFIPERWGTGLSLAGQGEAQSCSGTFHQTEGFLLWEFRRWSVLRAVVR